MNKKVEDYISFAMKVLEDANSDGNKIDSEYKGYLSSLGASITMSGLIPTLAFYSSKESSAKKERWRVLNWIAEILKNEDPYKTDLVAMDIFKYARLSQTNRSKLEADIKNASIALKLCIRTFDLEK